MHGMSYARSRCTERFRANFRTSAVSASPHLPVLSGLVFDDGLDSRQFVEFEPRELRVTSPPPVDRNRRGIIILSWSATPSPSAPSGMAAIRAARKPSACGILLLPRQVGIDLPKRQAGAAHMKARFIDP